MGVKLGDAIVFFRGDPRPLDDEQRGSEKKTRSWASRMGGLITGGIKVAAVGAAGAIAGVGISAIKAAVDALPLQGIKDAFAGISGEADKMMAALREGALGMVSDADLMETYNQAASLVGKNFADQLPEAMGYLSKVAAATGQDMGFMMNSLTLGVGRMSPMILDNLNIQVSATQATEKAVEMFGKQADALTKNEKQAGMMNVVLEKLAENTANMPDVAGSAATSLASLGVTMKNIKDRVGLALAPALGMLLVPLGKVANFLGDKMAAAAKTAGEWLSERIPQAIETTQNFLENRLLPGFRRVFGWIADNVAPRARKVVSWLRDKIPGAIQKAKSFLQGRLLPGFRVAWDWIEDNVFPRAQMVVSWLRDAIPRAIQTGAAFWRGKFLPGLQMAWNWIKDNVFPRARATVAWLKEKIPQAIETASIFWQTRFLPAMQTAWGWVQANVIPAAGRVVEWLRDKIPQAITTAKTFLETVLKPAVQNTFAWIRDVAIPALVEFATNLKTKIRDGAERAGVFISLFKDKVALAWAWIQETAIPAITAFADTLRIKMRRASLRARVYLSLFKSKIAEVWAWIQDTAIPGITAFTDLLRIKFKRASLRIRVHLSTIQNKIAGVWSWIQTTAVPWFQELWGKITSAIQDFRDGFANVSDKIMPTFRQALDVLRPAIDELKLAFAGLLEKLGLTGEKTGGLNIDFVALGEIVAGAVVNGIKLATIVIYGIVKALTWFVDLIGKVKDGFEAWAGVFDNIKTALGLLGDKFKAFWDLLPDALKPGSATPLEIGFKGIAAQIKSMPDLQLGVGGAAAAQNMGGLAAAGGGGTSTTVQFYGPVTFPSVTDSKSFLEELTAIGRGQ